MLKTKSKSRRPVLSARPRFIEPQLATLVDAPPSGSRWIHEIKFDGYRTLALIEPGSLRYLTRNGHDWSEKYRVLDDELHSLPCQSATLDGEICVTDEHGLTSFRALQSELGRSEPEALDFYVFDLLTLNGRDLRSLPLLERKTLLRDLVQKSGSKKVRFSEHHRGDPSKLLADGCAYGLEGVISKDSTAPYTSGRSDAWVKSKCLNEQEFVIVGYSLSQKKGGIKSLLLGVYDRVGKRKQLRYVGRVGTGFTQAELRRLLTRFQPLARKTSPLPEPVRLANRWRSADEVQWLRPELIAQVEFRGWTTDQQLRQASYKGLREDKRADEVRQERSAPC